MQAKLDYSSIGHEITMRADLGMMSSRDRLNLMQQLMRDFGLLEVLLQDEACKPAVTHINACIQNNW